MRKCKIFLSFLIVISMFFSLSMPIYAVNIKKDIQPRAWPGRPGGNGDGSEEWMTGSYGQMNGPYKLLGTSSGTVEDFNNRVAQIRNARTSLFLIASFFSVPLAVVSAAITIEDMYQENLVGRYYVYKTYVSGRRMKTVIDTYWGANQTNFERRYEKEISW